MVNPMCLLWDNSSFWVCTRSHTPPNGPFSHVLGCITPFTSFQCGVHIPSAPKSNLGIHPMYIKLRLGHLIGTSFMLGWVRMPESGVVQVASTTGHDLVFSRTKKHTLRAYIFCYLVAFVHVPGFEFCVLLLVIISRMVTKPTKFRIMPICIERVGPPLLNGLQFKFVF